MVYCNPLHTKLNWSWLSTLTVMLKRKFEMSVVVYQVFYLGQSPLWQCQSQVLSVLRILLQCWAANSHRDSMLLSPCAQVRWGYWVRISLTKDLVILELSNEGVAFCFFILGSCYCFWETTALGAASPGGLWSSICPLKWCQLEQFSSGLMGKCEQVFT